MDVSRIGWIGLGKMGGAMSRHLLDSNRALHVYDVVPTALEPFAKTAATIANSVGALVRDTDVIFTMIPDDLAIEQILFGADGLAGSLRPDQILVEMSTLSPAMSVRIAAVASEKGALYLRAPVSGSTATAMAAKLTVLASGPEIAYRAVEDLLGRFSVRRFYLGAGDEARYHKLVINLLVGSTAALVAEALTFGAKAGLTREAMLEVMSESAVASPLLAYKRQMLESGDFTAAFSVRQMVKDLGLILDAAADHHVPTMFTAMVKQQYEAATAQGDGDADFFCLLRGQAAAAGLDL